MRNLLEHPVTQEELTEFVGNLYSKQIEEDHKDLVVGDMSSYLLYIVFNKLKTGEWKV